MEVSIGGFEDLQLAPSTVKASIPGSLVNSLALVPSR